MPVLFVSHSSKDDAAAGSLETWLHANGFTDIFVDHHGIAGGEKWPEALRASAGACRVVVCLVSENWLTSHDCFSEFLAAWYMGKRIIPLFLFSQRANLGAEAEQRLARVCAEYQGVDLATCVGRDAVLDIDADRDVAGRLKTGLRAAGAISRVGLDPEAFAIDRTRRPTPFPGLVSFGDADADAALFYGRSREIAEALEELRKMRAGRDLRPFVILGASGAGKSSLLKAGIIPRMRRESPAWLPLRAFRPGADPLLNFAEALSLTLADFAKTEAHGVIRDRLLAVWYKAERAEGRLTVAGLAGLEGALEAEGQKLRMAAGCAAATILVSVDQAEEMARADGISGEALAEYLRVALAASSSSWQLAFTIRTDSFQELQSHRRFQDLRARGYDLRAIPVFLFDTVVEAPAKRYGVTVDNVLVDALMEDAPKEDALPLLAFALQRLWRQYAASGALTKDNYDKVGGLTGLIEDAAERALRGIEPEQDVPLPSVVPPKRLIDLGASTFVPALAQINERGAAIKRVAEWSSFDDEQQELLKRFDRWRLVVRKGEADGGTVEVAHEALFREWTSLFRVWLEPERARLETLRSLEVDAATWDRSGRDAGFLNHRGKRLGEANGLVDIERYRKRLGTLELDYLAACRDAERLARRHARRTQVVVGGLVAVLIAAMAGWWYEPSWLEGQASALALWLKEQKYRLIDVGVRTTEQERALKPKDDFTECTDCPVMVVVPAGEFIMGSPAHEKDRSGSEDPQHKVTIAKPFAVSRFEVTFAEWDACAAHGGCGRPYGRPYPNDNNWGRGRQPVSNLDGDDAKRYVAWLSRMTRREYRLLSEAEWEYAARAGSTTAYSWGDDIKKDDKAMANCNGCGSQWGGKPAPVNSFEPNAFGLYNMHGNVWELVEDCWNDTYKGAPANGSAWPMGDCARRVIRGGSWYYNPGELRSANRHWFTAGNRLFDLGLRVGRTLITP